MTVNSATSDPILFSDYLTDIKELKKLSYEKYLDIFQQGIKCLCSKEILDQSVEIDGNLMTGQEWLDKISKMPTDFDKKANDFFKKQTIRNDRVNERYLKITEENEVLRTEHVNLPLRRFFSVALLVAGLAIAIIGVAFLNIPLVAVGFIAILISTHLIRITYTTKVKDAGDQKIEEQKRRVEESREQMRKEYEDEEFLKSSLKKYIEKSKKQAKDRNEESCYGNCLCELDLR